MMKTVQVHNATKNRVILYKALYANTFFARFKGLLGRKALSPGEGLVIIPCNSVHTIGMSISIDVAFVDREGRVCHIIRRMPPNRLGGLVKEARYVIEGSSGSLSETEIGDEIKIFS